MITKFQIKKIHTLKKVLNICDEVYKDMLFSYGVNSSTELDYTSARDLVEKLEVTAEKIGCWVKKEKKYSSLKRDEIMASDCQLRMIESMWREICYFDNDKFAKKSLRTFLKKKFRVDDIMFLTKDKASNVIQSIKIIKKKVKSVAAL